MAASFPRGSPCRAHAYRRTSPGRSLPRAWKNCARTRPCASGRFFCLKAAFLSPGVYLTASTIGGAHLQIPFCHGCEFDLLFGKYHQRGFESFMGIRSTSVSDAVAALDERSREIFRRIVEGYLESGEPLGS